MNRLLKFVYIPLGFMSVAYFFVLWRSSRLGLSMSWMWPIIGAVLIACGVLSESPRIPRWAHIGWRCMLCLMLAVVMALESLVLSGMHATAPAGLDYLIVLGARVDPNGPSPALTRRLNAVLDCIGDHPDAIIIATGGQGRDEPMSEAQCIRNELVKRGVDAARILMEDRSTDTVQNLRNAMALMDDPAAQVGIITNNYHIYRAVHMARKVGLQNVYGIAAMYTGFTKFHYMIREAISLAVHWAKGNI